MRGATCAAVGGILLLVTTSAITMACTSAQESAATAAPVQVRGMTIAPKVSCADMSGRTVAASRIGLPTSGATITSASLKPGTGPAALPADYIPEYCEINGTVAPADPMAPPINFQVNIPTQWNQMAWQFGAGGNAGVVPEMVKILRWTTGSPLSWSNPPDLPYPIAFGYAIFGGDDGHQTPRNGPGSQPGQRKYPEVPSAAGDAWAAFVDGRMQAETDRVDAQNASRGISREQARAADPPWMKSDESFENWAHAAIKKTHDASLAIIQEMYAMGPRITYFAGNSSAGKTALVAAARYGADYDGVLSASGIAYHTGRAISESYFRELQRKPGAWVPPAKAAAVRNEVLRQCDALDNLADGVINDYYECQRLIDPTITPNPLAKIRCAGGADLGNSCLSDAQMATVNAFHSPTKIGFPMANGETEYPAWPAGSEAAAMWLVTANDPAKAPAGSGRDGMLSDRIPGWDLAKMNTPEIRAGVQAVSKINDVPVDWSPLLKRNGRLVMFHASTDYQVNFHAMAHLYEEAVKKNGEAAIEQNVRFYVTPDGGHGGLGISATTGEPNPPYHDLMTLLADWVENGVKPPEAVIQAMKEPTPPYTVSASKPMCRYPSYPRYNGSGDPKKAESYRCAAPGAATVTSSN